jgi:hypothetical protein
MTGRGQDRISLISWAQPLPDRPGFHPVRLELNGPGGFDIQMNFKEFSYFSREPVDNVNNH